MISDSEIVSAIEKRGIHRISDGPWSMICSDHKGRKYIVSRKMILGRQILFVKTERGLPIKVIKIRMK